MSSASTRVLLRLKQLTDISGVVIFFPSQLLIWLHTRVNKLNVIRKTHLSRCLTQSHAFPLSVSLPTTSTAPPRSLLLAYGSSPFYTGRFLPESGWWLFSFCPTPLRICTFKAASIRRELSLSLCIKVKSNMKRTSELSPFNPQQRGRNYVSRWIFKYLNQPCSI